MGSQDHVSDCYVTRALQNLLPAFIRSSQPLDSAIGCAATLKRLRVTVRAELGLLCMYASGRLLTWSDGRQKVVGRQEEGVAETGRTADSFASVLERGLAGDAHEGFDGTGIHVAESIDLGILDRPVGSSDSDLQVAGIRSFCITVEGRARVYGTAAGLRLRWLSAAEETKLRHTSSPIDRSFRGVVKPSRRHANALPTTTQPC